MASRNWMPSVERIEQRQRRRELIRALLEAAVRREEKKLGRPLSPQEIEQLARLWSDPTVGWDPQHPQ